jgi:hypothetical protein
MKGIDKDQRVADRKRLSDLRARVRELRGGRKAAIATAKARCAERRAAARSSCDVDLAAATGIAVDIAAARAARDKETKGQREIRGILRANKRAARTTKAERASESDDEVMQNIPAELVPLWERVRRSIKGTARKSRTEAFLEYAESHPSEIVSSEEDATDRLIAELEARQRMPNPGAGGLVLLGRLTELTWTGASRRVERQRWTYDRAPLLSYDRDGRLHVVYGQDLAGRASSSDRASYASTHWGTSGEGQLVAGVELRGPFAPSERLGQGVAITYTTRKNERELTDYVHEWGEGAAMWATPVRPSVVRARGLVALTGGNYRVTVRGIVG